MKRSGDLRRELHQHVTVRRKSTTGEHRERRVNVLRFVADPRANAADHRALHVKPGDLDIVFPDDARHAPGGCGQHLEILAAALVRRAVEASRAVAGNRDVLNQMNVEPEPSGLEMDGVAGARRHKVHDGFFHGVVGLARISAAQSSGLSSMPAASCQTVPAAEGPPPLLAKSESLLSLQSSSSTRVLCAAAQVAALSPAAPAPTMIASNRSNPVSSLGKALQYAAGPMLPASALQRRPEFGTRGYHRES